jgi:hypothetical protein
LRGIMYPHKMGQALGGPRGSGPGESVKKAGAPSR